MREEIQLEDFKLAFIEIWKQKIIIGIITIIGALVGLLVYAFTDHTVEYYSKATVYGASYGSYENSEAGTTAMIKYSEVGSSKKVCGRAASTINNGIIDGDTIQKMIYVSLNTESNIVTVYAYSTDPAVAVKVADAVAEAFVTEINNIVGSSAIQMLDGAEKYYISRDDNPLKTIVIVMAIAFVGSCLVVAVKELFSSKVKTIAQCTDGTDKIIGILPLE